MALAWSSRECQTLAVTSWSAVGPQQWPFVGREELIGVLQTLLSGGVTRGVIIDGPAGIGKTRLADEFSRSLRGVGAARCVGSPTTHSTPYGSIAHLLPSDLPLDHERDSRAAFNALRAQLGPGRTVLIADDIVFLDDSTVALLAHLLAADEVFLVGTVRTDHVVPPGLDSLVRSYGLRWLSLAPLDDESIAGAAEAVIGAPLEPISAQRLVARSGGNPLYVRELLLQSLATDSVELLPSGAARLDIDVSSVPRLVEVVSNRLAAVPASLLPLLQMIAIAEPLMLADLERAQLADDAVQLEQRGWIRADPRGAAVEIRVAHPLHSEVLRASMGTIEYRRQVARAAELLRQRPVPERDDPLRIALWELDAGLQPSGSVLLDGARRARVAVDLHSTLRLVEAAYHAEPSQAARHIWLEVLFLLSRFEEAEAVAALPHSGDTDLRLTVSSMMLRMDNLLWGVGDVERALELVHSFRPEFAAIGIDFLLAIPEAFIYGVDGQSARALELLGPVPDDPQIFLLASLAHINAHAGRGHFGEVEALCRRGLDILNSLPDPRGSMDPIFFRLNRGMARNHSGRSAEVYAEFVLVYGSVVEERQAFMRCFVGFVTGQAALNQGFLESADQWFAETDYATRELSLPTARSIAVAGRAAVAGQRDDVVAAAAFLEQLDALPPDVNFMRVETRAGRAWALHCLGRIGEARDAVRVAVEWAIAGDEPVSALLGLVEACRLGDGKWAADRIDRIGGLAGIEGPLARAQQGLVRACGGRLGGPFLAAARGLFDCDVHLVAAEAATWAVTAFDRDGDRREAAAARAVLALALAKCDAAATPALRGTNSPTSPLSAREAEVAHLAAAGMTSKEIAERLYLSPRTVENHLQRVYTKLGVAGRDDLAGVLS